MVHVVVILDFVAGEAVTSLTSKELRVTDLVVHGSKGCYRCGDCNYSNDILHFSIFKMDLSDPQKRLMRGSASVATLQQHYKNKKKLMHHIITSGREKKSGP
jgi:hypothetical protein